MLSWIFLLPALSLLAAGLLVIAALLAVLR